MSTSWNMRCINHPGELFLDEYWDGPGDGDTPARNLSDVWRNREKLIAAFDAVLVFESMHFEFLWKGYLPLYAWQHGTWLGTHKDCNVELINEYGDVREPDLTPKPPHHCKTCSCEPK